MNKSCKKCKLIKSVSEFAKNKRLPDKLQLYCKSCKNKEGKKYYYDNIEMIKTKRVGTYSRKKEYFRKYNAKHKYNLNEQEYLKLMSVGCCQICGTTKTGKHGFCIDHCHKSGEVRGLLCHLCNVALGAFKDDKNLLQKAINYLDISRKVC